MNQLSSVSKQSKPYTFWELVGSMHRLGRLGYFLLNLFYLELIILTIGLIAFSINFNSIEMAISFVLLGSFFVMIIVASVLSAIRRFHDVGWSGFNFFWFFIPLIGSVLHIALFIMRSDADTNKYGDERKAITRECRFLHLLLMCLTVIFSIASIHVLNEVSWHRYYSDSYSIEFPGKPSKQFENTYYQTFLYKSSKYILKSMYLNLIDESAGQLQQELGVKNLNDILRLPQKVFVRNFIGVSNKFDPSVTKDIRFKKYGLSGREVCLTTTNGNVQYDIFIKNHVVFEIQGLSTPNSDGGQIVNHFINSFKLVYGTLS